MNGKIKGDRKREGEGDRWELFYFQIKIPPTKMINSKPYSQNKKLATKIETNIRWNLKNNRDKGFYKRHLEEITKKNQT